MELQTTVGVALVELLATKGSSSLKLSVMVGTGMASSLFKQLKINTNRIIIQNVLNRTIAC